MRRTRSASAKSKVGGLRARIRCCAKDRPGARCPSRTARVSDRGERRDRTAASRRGANAIAVSEGRCRRANRPRQGEEKKSAQLSLGFVADLEEAEASGGWGETGAPHKGETVLDRVHQSMILFGAGRGEALKRFLVDDGAGRDDRFWRLAQAFSALYPDRRTRNAG